MVTYGDGLADVDIAELLDVPQVARQAGDRDDRAADLALRHPRRRRRRPGAAVRREAAGRRLGQRRVLRLRPQGVRLPDGDDCVLEREPLERLAADGQLMAYRHDGLLLRDGHLPRVPVPQRAVGAAGGAVEGVGVSGRSLLAGSAHPRHRGHRPGRRLAGAAAGRGGADVVCLVRDWVPQSELVRSGTTSSR